MPPNKAYLDSSRKLNLVPDGLTQKVRLQSYLRPRGGALGLRAMMESRARGANR
jgi:hypothetical protein